MGERQAGASYSCLEKGERDFHRHLLTSAVVKAFSARVPWKMCTWCLFSSEAIISQERKSLDHIL